MFKRCTRLLALSLTVVCSFGFLAGANAATATKPSSKSGPVFFEDNSPYPMSEAARIGNILYISAQSGTIEGKLVKGGITSETTQALDNISTILFKHGYQKSDLVKCVAMLTDMDDFEDFNKAYRATLTRPYPVRSAFGVSELALGASVEIECMAAQ